jgi:rare lipoprotein A
MSPSPSDLVPQPSGRPRALALEARSSHLPAAACLAALVAAIGCAAPRQGEQVRHTEIGMASHYAERFAGRKTASGEIYRPNALTAAHRTLPMGTRLRVTRIDRLGHDVAGPIIVVVNDRGPFVHGRIIDLSSEAARRLGLYGTIGRVRIEVLERPGPGPNSPKS